MAIQLLGRLIIVGWTSVRSTKPKLRAVETISGRGYDSDDHIVFDDIDDAASQGEDGPPCLFAALLRTNGHLLRGVGLLQVSMEQNGTLIAQEDLDTTDIGVAELVSHPYLPLLHRCFAGASESVLGEIVGEQVNIRPLGDMGPFHIDNIVRCGNAIVAAGWIADLRRRRIHVVDDLLCEAVVKDNILLRSRSDVHQHLRSERVSVGQDDGHGFTFVLAERQRSGRSVYLVENRPDGSGSTFFGPLEKPREENTALAADMVVDPFGSVFAIPRALSDRVYRPLVAQDFDRPSANRRHYGPPLTDEIRPRYSIIIPFYGDAFFLSCVFHLQRLLDDRYEIVIVVDDPKLWPPISDALEKRSSAIAVRTVVLRNRANYGYAWANNLGARAASGDVLLLMNSDILVENIEAITTALEHISDARAVGEDVIVGFMLRYEDGTVQHVGMEFAKDPALRDLYLVEHPMKGLPASLYKGAKVENVPAVTGALLGISADLYNRLGGLDVSFIWGDFEDADLCLSARNLGANIELHAEPGLYHLERQSYTHMAGDKLRQIITYLNCVEFNRRWSSQHFDAARVVKGRRKSRMSVPVATDPSALKV